MTITVIFLDQCSPANVLGSDLALIFRDIDRHRRLTPLYKSYLLLGIMHVEARGSKSVTFRDWNNESTVPTSLGPFYLQTSLLRRPKIHNVPEFGTYQSNYHSDWAFKTTFCSLLCQLSGTIQYQSKKPSYEGVNSNEPNLYKERWSAARKIVSWNHSTVI